MTQKILITDAVHSLLLEGLTDLGYEVMYEPAFNPENLKSVVPELSGIVINSKIIMDASILSMCPKLKFIARLGSGLEIIDLNECRKRNIAVFNSPEGNRNAVGEHALGMLLALSNNLIKADLEVRQKIWKREENRGFELEGKTIGIIGLGNTGREFARKLSSWALQIIYFDPYVEENPDGMDYLSKVSMKALMKEADIVSLHVPLNAETKYMINSAFIENCKQGVIIINTSRGKVIDTESLIHGLKTGKIGGACLDVFENEKPHHFSDEEDQLYKELYNMDNVVLSPHIAGWTSESFKKIAEILLTKIASLPA